MIGAGGSEQSDEVHDDLDVDEVAQDAFPSWRDVVSMPLADLDPNDIPDGIFPPRPADPSTQND